MAMASAFQIGDPDKCYELNKQLDRLIAKIERSGYSYSSGLQTLSGTSDFMVTLLSDERYIKDQFAC